MRVLKKNQVKRLCRLAILILACQVLTVRADFELTSMEAFVTDGLLQVDADAELVIPEQTQVALDSGVDFRIQFLVELSRDRSWIWDARIKAWEMLFTLHFHQLSSQYILATPQSDSIQAFNTLEQALGAISSQLSFNLGYQEVLNRYQKLYVRTRIRLDTKFLPAPLRLFALVSSDWKLDSGWSEWTLDQ